MLEEATTSRCPLRHPDYDVLLHDVLSRLPDGSSLEDVLGDLPDDCDCFPDDGMCCPDDPIENVFSAFGIGSGDPPHSDQKQESPPPLAIYVHGPA
jgi:hypothetical protein